VPWHHYWRGRQPAFFWTENAKVHDGALHLTMRKEEAPDQPRDRGYKDYTSACVSSVGLVKYGYFEIRARPMRSAGSSAFWFQTNKGEATTEIDVFEIGGAAPGFERLYNMNLHVFDRRPGGQGHWSRGGVWTAPWDLADDFHVYGLEWDEESVKYYVDGVPVRTTPNTDWHQELYLYFDSETMPNWFGMPRDEDLPSTYTVEYVRAWQKR
jgi:beta-glucanase (GH16 family)